jgi:phosphohistidine phosphatase SixA
MVLLPENVALIRHGKADDKDVLVDMGRMQAGYAGEVLGRLFPDKERVVIASAAPRAIETAEIIAATMRLTGRMKGVIPYEPLWSDEDHEIDLEGTLWAIKEHNQCDVVVVVTHHHHVMQFPDYFAERELGMPNAHWGGERHNGRGWNMSRSRRTCTAINIPESH